MHVGQLLINILFISAVLYHCTTDAMQILQKLNTVLQIKRNIRT